MFFFGGMQGYRQKLQECVDNGYHGMKPFNTATGVSARL